MTRPNRLDGALLLLAAACLFLGGGFGCEEDNDGVSFRAAEIMGDRYYGITGKKEPGAGSLRFPYELDPPISFELRGGVFDLDLVGASANSTGFVRLEREDLLESYELRARYELTPSVGIRLSSNLNATEVFCTSQTRVRMRIQDDAMNATLSYDCGAGWLQLTSVASHFTGGEKWFARVGVRDLMKGGQYAFDDYQLDSSAPTSPTPERQVAFSTFDHFRFGLRAYYELEDGDLAGAQNQAGIALGALSAARNLVESGVADFPDSGAEKLLLKLDKSYFKLYQGLFDGKDDKYLKSYPKLADIDACAAEEMLPFF